MENKPTDIQSTPQNEPIKLSYEQKINTELKQAQDSIRDASNRMPISISGILAILFGFVGLFIGRLGFGILALILAIFARKYQNDLPGFYLGIALAIIDLLIFAFFWAMFHLFGASMWV